MLKKVGVAAALALAMSVTTVHAFSFPSFGCQKQLMVEKGANPFAQFQKLFQQIYQQLFGCKR